MKLIELTSVLGERVVIRADRITAVVASEDSLNYHTYVYVGSAHRDSRFDVTDSVDSVLAMLKESTKLFI